MRRTRGEMGRVFLFAGAARDVADFFVEEADLRAAVFAPDWSGSVFAPGALGAVGACLSGESAAAGFEDCCGRAMESALLADAHAPARTSTHHHLRPNWTTFTFLRAETRKPEPFAVSTWERLR